MNDDEVRFLDLLGLSVRFYGGGGSAEYKYIWVDSNGLIVFYDPKAPEPASYPTPPERIGWNPSPPNGFIAPFWKDLKPDKGGNIKYGIVDHHVSKVEIIKAFVVSWDEVPDANGVPQSFQVVMEKAPYGTLGREKHGQSRIWIQYKSITFDPLTAHRIGIEDQAGRMGVAYDYTRLANKSVLVFEQNSNSAFIERLTIKLIENEALAETIIVNHRKSVRGHNVILNASLPAKDNLVAIAIKGTAPMLLEVVNALWLKIPGFGFMIGTVFLGIELAEWAAEQQMKGTLFQYNDTHASAHALLDPDKVFVSNAMDADLGITAYWILKSPNTQSHKLKIVAELDYWEYRLSDGQPVAARKISTEVELFMPGDAGNNINDPNVRELPGSGRWKCFLGGGDSSDFFKVWMENVHVITVETSLVKNETSWPMFFDLDLYLYDFSGTLLASSSISDKGQERIQRWHDGSGTWWYIEARWSLPNSGIYEIKLTLSYYPSSTDPSRGAVDTLERISG